MPHFSPPRTGRPECSVRRSSWPCRSTLCQRSAAPGVGVTLSPREGKYVSPPSASHACVRRGVQAGCRRGAGKMRASCWQGESGGRQGQDAGELQAGASSHQVDKDRDQAVARGTHALRRARVRRREVVDVLAVLLPRRVVHHLALLGVRGAQPGQPSRALDSAADRARRRAARQARLAAAATAPLAAAAAAAPTATVAAAPLLLVVVRGSGERAPARGAALHLPPRARARVGGGEADAGARHDRGRLVRREKALDHRHLRVAPQRAHAHRPPPRHHAYAARRAAATTRRVASRAATVTATTTARRRVGACSRRAGGVTPIAAAVAAPLVPSHKGARVAERAEVGGRAACAQLERQQRLVLEKGDSSTWGRPQAGS